MTALKSMGRYTLLEEIARGAYGIVYRAHDGETGRIVALKTPRSESASKKTLGRFVREARLGSRLRHPNIVRIFDLSTHEGLPYFTMELLEGESLAQRLARAPLPPEEAAEIARTLARTLAFAHARGVIHRDIKPSNIVLTPRGPVLTDFGIARDPLSPDRLTATDELLGTPVYMAPEQLDGRIKTADERCDIYGLGVVLYEMLTGRPPFTASTFAELSMKILHDDPEPPPIFGDVCLKCLRKNPRDRYSSAEELAEDLRFTQPRSWLTRALLATLLVAALVGAALLLK